MTKVKHIIAVYGSLRKELPLSGVLRSEKFIGYGKVEGTIQPVGGAFFPGFIEGSNSKVIVEVYEVTEEVLNRLDNIEGYYQDVPEQSMYIRKKILVDLDDSKKPIISYIYVWNGKRRPLSTPIIESGDWVAHKKEFVYDR